MFDVRHSAREVPPDDAYELIAGGRRVVDVREAWEYDAGHVAGALHIALSELSERMADVPAEERWIAVCRSGNRSARAAALLASQGRDVVNLQGGLTRWHGHGYPLVDVHGGAGTVV